jgi:hypothetical protein
MAHRTDIDAPESAVSDPDPLFDFGLCLRGERVLDSRLARRLAQAGIDLWDLPRSLTDRAVSVSLGTRRFGLI